MDRNPTEALIDISYEYDVLPMAPLAEEYGKALRQTLGSSSLKSRSLPRCSWIMYDPDSLILLLKRTTSLNGEETRPGFAAR